MKQAGKESEMNDQDADKYERYFLGQLSEEERNELENEFRTNSEVREEMEWFGKFIAVYRQSRLEHATSKVLEIVKKRKSQATRRIRIYISAAAASLLIIATMSIFLINPQHKRLFNEFYQPDNSYVISQSSVSVDSFIQAMISFKAGDYSAAEKAFSALPQAMKDADSTHYFLAQSQLGAGKYDLAKIEFEKVLTIIPQSRYIEDAEWYLALLYLRSNDIPMAKESLKQIHQPGKVYRERAGKLLEKLK